MSSATIAPPTTPRGTAGAGMHQVTSRDGTTIAYDQTGSGPAVIFVGGAWSYRAYVGNARLAELLRDRFTVISYDRRGRGDSGDTKPYAVAREVEDLDALIQAAGGSAHVYGMSSGAALALEAAASGLNITRLALYEPPYMVGEGGHRPPADHQQHLVSLIAADRRSEANLYFMRKVMGIPALIVFVMRLFPFWSKLKAVAHTLPYDSAIMGDFSLPTARAAAVRVPTLVIGGEKSPEVLRRAVQAVADVVPLAERRVLKGQTHNVSMKVLAPVLAEFFGR